MADFASAYLGARAIYLGSIVDAPSAVLGAPLYVLAMHDSGGSRRIWRDSVPTAANAPAAVTPPYLTSTLTVLSRG